MKIIKRIKKSLFRSKSSVKSPLEEDCNRSSDTLTDSHTSEVMELPSLKDYSTKAGKDLNTPDSLTSWGMMSIADVQRLIREQSKHDPNMTRLEE